MPLNLRFDLYHFSALGNLRIGDVHPGGHFVKILNSSPVIEESIGDYILQKNANGQAVAVFRFPPNIRMSANSTVTVSVESELTQPKCNMYNSTAPYLLQHKD